MPRPVRIEYENACYHVMSAGRASGAGVFHSQKYYSIFYDILEETIERFNIQIFGYCLLKNEYHLIIQTPLANLGRVMRHINGVFTQRYNHLKSIDGPLFKGRYKAVLIDQKNYLLDLSCYIHRLPVDGHLKLAKLTRDYLNSSYQAYLNLVETPSWLSCDVVLRQLEAKNKNQIINRNYSEYVEQGSLQSIRRFYGRKNLASVIGDKKFVSWVKSKCLSNIDEQTFIQQVIPKTLPIALIIQLVAKCYQLKSKDIVVVKRGPSKGLTARNVAIYLCQQLAGYKLKNIMSHFGLTNIGSVSFITSKVRKKIREDKEFSCEMEWLKKYIMNQAV